MTRNKMELLAWLVLAALLAAAWQLFDLNPAALVFFSIAALGRLWAVRSGSATRDQAAAERWTLDRLRARRDKR